MRARLFINKKAHNLTYKHQVALHLELPVAADVIMLILMHVS